MRRLAATFVVVLAACGGTPGDPADLPPAETTGGETPAEVATDAADPGPDLPDPPPDLAEPTPDLAEPADDAPGKDAPDPNDVPVLFDVPDAAPDAPDTPEAADAADATGPADAPAEADVAWVCVPGARSCDGSLLRTCSQDGSGFVSESDCDDHDACTTGDGCLGTKCLPTDPLDCEDDNACTADSCDPALGCVNDGAALDGQPCDDSDPCTAGDRCKGGVCLSGTAGGCDDGNACTDDWCASVIGCIHEPNAAPCDDADPCTTGDACGLGLCRGVPVDCADPDPCTIDGCDPLTGECVHVCVPCPSDDACADEWPCTRDRCVEGACVHLPSEDPGCCGGRGGCEDLDPCTADSCGAHGACVHVAIPGPGCCEPAVFAEGFETGGEAFTLDPPDGGVGWQVIATPDAASGAHALWYGDPSDGDYDNGMANAGVAIGPEVRIPAGAATTLGFQTWQDVEDQPGHDRFTVRAVASDREFDLWARPAGFGMGAWQEVEVDVSPLAGRTVRLALAFATADALGNGGAGVFVDDLRLDSTCEPRPCVVGLDCTALGIHGWCQAGACDYGQGIRFEAGIPLPIGAGPAAVAEAPDGAALFVTDRPGARVLVFSAGGQPLGAFGAGGAGEGMLSEPRAVAVTADRVYVADTGNHRVAVFTPPGIPLFSFGGEGSDPGRMLDPKGVGVSPDHQTVFVADTSNHRVQAFGAAGGFSHAWGGYGKKDGEFRSPSCISVAATGEVAVCDTQNARVTIFAPDGTFLRKVQPTGTFALWNPYGAAFRWDGLLAVTDTYNHRIALFDGQGVLLDRFGAWGEEGGALAYPLGIAWTAAGGLAVADSGNARVSRFGFGSP